MRILVVNCGSSSVKYRLYDMESESSLAYGLVERIGKNPARVLHVSEDKSIEREAEVQDHYSAIKVISGILTDPEDGLLSEISDLGAIGHRVVHGGEKYFESVKIDEDVIADIEGLSELAPLHNPPSLEGIKACRSIFPGFFQVAVFDTAFHHRMPEHAYRYGLPEELCRKHKIRRYGFHGTSHRYVAHRAAEKIGGQISELNIITVHLGNGCSIAAVAGGVSVDTSMGFTPLEGLLMGTRSGDLDPAVVTFLMEKESISPGEMDKLMNKKSGLLGVSGVSNDMRDILEAVEQGNARAKLAYDMFVYRIKKYIGAYAAALGRVDAIVFTAGIGENVPRIRESIEKDLRGLFNSPPEFLTVGTNEELLIASDTYELMKSKN